MALASILRRSHIILDITHAVRKVANLSYKIFGESDVDPDSPPIFLFHGLLGTKKHWESFGKTMMNMTQRIVVAVDLRNHGDSPHVNSHKYDDMAGDILKLFSKLSIEKASVVGHGMGGRASMYVSLMAEWANEQIIYFWFGKTPFVKGLCTLKSTNKKPEKISALLVVDISPVSTCVDLREQFPKIMSMMKEFSFKEQKKVKIAQREVKKKLKTLISDEILLKAILSNVTIRSTGIIGWSCNLDVLIKEFKHIITFPRLKNKIYYGPTLFIGGQLSDYLPPDDLTAIRDMFPRAVITYIPHTGHSLYADDPKSFLEVAIAFLKTND
ncbi:protein ABHD11-like isoform X1 [Pieris brassicae]|uniref:protein ABHD11-like isoform X1 n=1 Tax=Pieris brassicae TaxID=7116 RepID=UPI001E65FD3E|nr:protein ABHD11-like isoform X1 [Pieris brassicae]